MTCDRENNCYIYNCCQIVAWLRILSRGVYIRCIYIYVYVSSLQSCWLDVAMQYSGLRSRLPVLTQPFLSPRSDFSCGCFFRCLLSAPEAADCAVYTSHWYRITAAHLLSLATENLKDRHHTMLALWWGGHLGARLHPPHPPTNQLLGPPLPP